MKPHDIERAVLDAAAIAAVMLFLLCILYF